MPMPNSFDYAVVRVVPRVEREEFVNAGVIVFCATRRFLGARIGLDVRRLIALAPDVDADDVQRHLVLVSLVCDGDPTTEPIGQMPPAARFHWLVAPRSTIIQTSPVHSGLCDDPRAALDHLFDTMVRVPPVSNLQET
jgi:hypothetical protein